MPKNNEETDTRVEYIDNVIERGIEKHALKHEQSKLMNAIAKNAAEDTDVEKKDIMKMKDYVHYRGRGWGEDALDKSEEKEKFPDRVSPTFRKLVEIVTVMYECGMEDMLDVYTSALKLRGITLNIDKSMFAHPDANAKMTIAQAVEDMQPYQTRICEENDYMTDVLAVAAEQQNVTPKNKYKKVVEFAWKRDEGKDIDDKVQEEQLHNEMYAKSLDDINK